MLSYNFVALYCIYPIVLVEVPLKSLVQLLCKSSKPCPRLSFVLEKAAMKQQLLRRLFWRGVTFYL